MDLETVGVGCHGHCGDYQCFEVLKSLAVVASGGFAEFADLEKQSHRDELACYCEEYGALAPMPQGCRMLPRNRLERDSLEKT